MSETQGRESSRQGIKEPEIRRQVLGEQYVDSLAEKELRARVELAKRGQNFALASLIIVISAILTLGLTNHDWLAGGIGGAYLVSVVGLFITGRYHDDKGKGV